jgi:hypothetical protein
MKKILAIAIAAIMTVALCVSASANLNVDRIFINANDMSEGTDVKDNDPIEINAGDKVYILGWAANPDGALTEIVWSVDGGADQKCSDIYRDRADVAGAGIAVADNGTHAGFGVDAAADGGLMELIGIGSVAGGAHVLTLKAIYADGTNETKDYNINISGEAAPAEEKSEDQWLCGSEPDATQAPSWWFNPLCTPEQNTDGRQITVNFKAAGYFSGISVFAYCNAADLGEASTKVELIADGATVAEGAIVSEGDKAYDVDFGKSFAPGTYSLKFTPLTGNNTANGTWFVLGGFAGTGEDVSVDHNVNGPADGIQPSIKLVGATPSGSAPTPGGNPKTADAAVIAIAAVAVVALAGVVVAKKVR